MKPGILVETIHLDTMDPRELLEKISGLPEVWWIDKDGKIWKPFKPTVLDIFAQLATDQVTNYSMVINYQGSSIVSLAFQRRENHGWMRIDFCDPDLSAVIAIGTFKEGEISTIRVHCAPESVIDWLKSVCENILES